MIGLNLPRFCYVMVLLLIVLAVSGCAEWNGLKSGVQEYGSTAADESLDVALWQMCQAATVGSVKRRFKTVQEINAYNALCKDFLPISAD